ncbi:MAG: UDP-galactopyranose mutase [Alistipes sp.]|nr:UDP-galactopyranose mutase [Alistipes sp.]
MKQTHTYDYLIVGSGLFGAVAAYRANKLGHKVLVVERRSHVGGNVRCEMCGEIVVHKYGPHIFHTSNREVWEFVTSLTPFHPYINSPIANYNGELFNLPFNLNTFRQLWGEDITADEARNIIEQQRRQSGITEPRNLEEQAIAMVGQDIYEKLIKGYTEKQWGRPCSELPAEIIRRLPVRFTADNNYFNDTYQGIPDGGYNVLIDRLLEGIEVRTDCDFIAERNVLMPLAEKIIYTGEIDRYFDYRLGRLEYRSLRFEDERLAQKSFQSAAVVNYTDSTTPFTRIIEHKHFDSRSRDLPYTLITREYPLEWRAEGEPYYPINNSRNAELADAYRQLAAAEERVIFGGRLAEYRYYDMHHVVEKALSLEL